MASSFPLPQLEISGQASLLTHSEPADDVYVMPASLAQQRFWLLDQLQPGNTSLNMPLALRLTGALDEMILQRALNEIVSRHEILRTTFRSDNGRPTQVISTGHRPTLDLLDLTGRSDREEEKDRLVLAEAHSIFDLEHGPLFKTKLIKLAADQHILLLTMHHIVCDGWSNGVLVRELGEIYEAFLNGCLSPYEELPIQYADFAVWQSEWLRSEGFDDQVSYWKQQLGTELPSLELPTDFPREKNRTSLGSIESLLLPNSLTRAIKALAQREEVTSYMIFLASFNLLLSVYGKQDEILVGSPTANRFPAETEMLIGPFANTLLLKSDLAGDPTFKELLERTKDVVLGAFSNQEMPFEKLLETVRPSQRRRGGQLFQVLFIYQNAFMKPMELSRLSIEPIRSVSPGSIFELSLGVVERAEGIRLQMEYSTNLFKPATVRRMLEDMQEILRSAVLDSGQNISRLLKSRENLDSGSQTVENAAIPNDSKIESVAVSANSEGKVLETLKDIWKEVLHLDSIGIHDDFFEVGGHSLLAAQLFNEIGKRLGVNLTLATLFHASTVEQLAKVIRDETPESVQTSLVSINEKGTRSPLFLMHAAGGNVLFYKDLARHLGQDQPVFALQSQGLDGEDFVPKRVEDIAEHYIQEIRTVQPAGPYVLGGMCFGGYLALEVAQQLRSQGQDVAHLIVFDSGAPRITDASPNRQRKSLGYYVEKSLASLLSGEFYRTFLAWCAETKFSRRISDQLRLRKARKTAGHLVQRNRSMERLYIIAARNYIASPYEGRVTLIRSEEFSALQRKNGHLEWGKLAHGGFEHFVVPGRHLELFREPTVKVLAERLSNLLNA